MFLAFDLQAKVLLTVLDIQHKNSKQVDKYIETFRIQIAIHQTIEKHSSSNPRHLTNSLSTCEYAVGPTSGYQSVN